MLNGCEQYEICLNLKDNSNKIMNVENNLEIMALLNENNIITSDRKSNSLYGFTRNPSNICGFAIGLTNILFLYMFIKRSQMVKNLTSKSNYKKFGQFNIKTRYKDVAGLDEAKQEL